MSPPTFYDDRFSDSSSSSQYSHASDISRRSSAPSSCDFDFDTFLSPLCAFDLRASSETYASTVASEVEPSEEACDFAVPEYQRDVFDHPEPLACTPPEFAELFPSSRRLLIRHDDTTIDGNMNIRVDTEVNMAKGRKAPFTLFHMRMYDLKNRDFSLRRYCRDSGREVCHTSRRHAKPAAERRPGLQRSVTHAFSSFRGKQDSAKSSGHGLKRQDSGYSTSSLDDLDETTATDASRAMPAPTNTTKLEFSSYAQVNLKRRGAKAGKRYAFEYWGHSYSWKREVRKDGNGKEISYHLVNNNTSVVAAHIVPEFLTTAQLHDERARGGWVPPCSMWISDANVFDDVTDVADVIVATGLVALIDDAIKMRFSSKRTAQLVLPVPAKTMMEYVGPKKLIDEVFHRRSSSRSRERNSPRLIMA